MKRSETFGSFAKSFSQFQAEVKNPALTANNPHLKSKYAPLSEVINTVRPILAKYGLSFYQDVASEDDKVKVTTTLFHESGEYLESSPLYIPGSRGAGKPADAQGIGSAASYAKRYQLQAVCGVAAEEDTDGEDLIQQPNAINDLLPTNMTPQISKQSLAAKYQLGTGSRDGFDDYYNEKINEGWKHEDINKALDKALAKKKAQPVA
jgi:hypothetical protein